MKDKICLCPESIHWIKKHLLKSAKAKFAKMIKVGSIKKVKKRKKKRSKKQIAATKKLIAWNKANK